MYVAVVADPEYCSNMMRFVVDVDAHITFAAPPCRRQMHLTSFILVVLKLSIINDDTCLTVSWKALERGAERRVMRWSVGLTNTSSSSQNVN